jgi:peptide-methionine (S)-S-oxide reductase
MAVSSNILDPNPTEGMMAINNPAPRLLITNLFIAGLFFCTPTLFAGFPDPPSAQLKSRLGKETAVLAGGCFWGMEGVFERLRGVTKVTSGYAGGKKETAFYDKVETGRTGHAECVRIEFNPSQITFGTLLKVFFSIAHDPTQLYYQGPDKGTQYRSAIFYTSAEQKQIAEEYIRILNLAKTFSKPIVTQVTPLEAFYPAEAYHQNFLDRHPDYPYIVYWDLPKIKRLKKEFPGLVSRP